MAPMTKEQAGAADRTSMDWRVDGTSVYTQPEPTGWSVSGVPEVASAFTIWIEPFGHAGTTHADAEALARRIASFLRWDSER